MILWMRALQRSGKGRIEFLGFDMQEPKVAAANVRTFVAKGRPRLREVAHRPGLRRTGLLPPVSEGTGSGRRTTRSEAARAETGKLAAAASEVVWRTWRRTATGSSGVADAAVGRLGDPERPHRRPGGHVAHRPRRLPRPLHGGECRLDSRAPPAAAPRSVLWAHNGHVSRRPGAMGGFLSRRHGADMVVVGFAFHSGRYTAVAPGTGLKANDAARPSRGASSGHSTRPDCRAPSSTCVRSIRHPLHRGGSPNRSATAASGPLPWARGSRPMTCRRTTTC